MDSSYINFSDFPFMVVTLTKIYITNILAKIIEREHPVRLDLPLNKVLPFLPIKRRN